MFRDLLAFYSGDFVFCACVLDCHLGIGIRVDEQEDTNFPSRDYCRKYSFSMSKQVKSKINLIKKSRKLKKLKLGYFPSWFEAIAAMLLVVIGGAIAVFLFWSL